eukprot:1019643-Pelagomonas_calceolata.AAC.2
MQYAAPCTCQCFTHAVPSTRHLPPPCYTQHAAPANAERDAQHMVPANAMLHAAPAGASCTQNAQYAALATTMQHAASATPYRSQQQLPLLAKHSGRWKLGTRPRMGPSSGQGSGYALTKCGSRCKP